MRSYISINRNQIQVIQRKDIKASNDDQFVAFPRDNSYIDHVVVEGLGCRYSHIIDTLLVYNGVNHDSCFSTVDQMVDWALLNYDPKLPRLRAEENQAKKGLRISFVTV